MHDLIHLPDDSKINKNLEGKLVNSEVDLILWKIEKPIKIGTLYAQHMEKEKEQVANFVRQYAPRDKKRVIDHG